MRDLVIHAPSGQVLDFAEVDFGGPEQAAIVADWRVRRQAGRSPLISEGELICHRHRNRERPWLYLQQRNGLLIAAHWSGTALAGSHEITHGVSDEHKRQVEYVRRAGEYVGYHVKTEVTLTTKVRPDAIIYGPHEVGIEVQRSHLTVAAAKARTTKARQAGIESLWISDNRSDPKWIGKVPGVRMQDLPWDEVPPPGFVKVVSGVQTLVPRRCRNMHNGGCSERRYGCNQWHPDREPYPVLIDDLAEAIPDGRVVPILWRPFGGPGLVLLVKAHDKARYERMTGQAADLPLKLRERPQPQQTDRIDCTTDAGALVVVESPGVPVANDCNDAVLRQPFATNISLRVSPILRRSKCWHCKYSATSLVIVPSASGPQEVASCAQHLQMLVQAWSA